MASVTITLSGPQTAAAVQDEQELQQKIEAQGVNVTLAAGPTDGSVTQLTIDSTDLPAGFVMPDLSTLSTPLTPVAAPAPVTPDNPAAPAAPVDPTSDPTADPTAAPATPAAPTSNTPNTPVVPKGFDATQYAQDLYAHEAVPQTGTGNGQELYDPNLGAQASDVQQGGIGDCYFLSTLANIANTNPGLIQQNIQPTNDGTGDYNVTLYNSDGSAQPITVTPSDLAADSNGNNAAVGSDGMQHTWVNVYEAAMTKFYNTYPSQYPNSHENGGIASDAYAMITGDASQQSNTATLGSNLKSTLEEANSGQAIEAGGGSGQGVIGDHYYSVEGTSPDGNTVYLRNPWGAGEGSPVPQGATPLGDGKFSMSLDAFQQTFGFIDTGSSLSNTVAANRTSY